MIKKFLAGTAVLVLLSGCAVTPEPLTRDEIKEQVQQNLDQIKASHEPVTNAISLYEAMARAIKYNLDYKVSMMEEALSVGELKNTTWDMLPKLVASGYYNDRNKYSGASSSELLGSNTVGDQSLVSSTSSEKDTFTADIQLSWDVLDFGLSYTRAKQQADKVLIANERKRKVVNRIIEDVRTAYWRAVSAHRLLEEVKQIRGDVEAALRSSSKAYEGGKTTPLASLTYQRELLDIKEEILKLDGDLFIAKQQLAALMSLEPGKQFELVVPERSLEKPLIIDTDVMLDTALHNRPELREAAYNKRINKNEATAELLRLLPSLRIFGGMNWDSNEYLYNGNWTAWGAQASWNLIQVFSYPVRKDTIEARESLIHEQSLAMTLAIMTEVHISRVRYGYALRKLDTAGQIHNIQSKILEQISAGHTSQRISQQAYIRERMNTLLTNVKYDIAYADMQNAMANIYASMGLDPFNNNIVGDETVAMLAQKLKQHWQDRNNALMHTRP